MKREVEWLDFGEWVKEKRRKMGYTQEQLARMVSVNKNTLSGYLKGYNRMPLDIAEKLCNVLDAELVVRENE